MGYNIIESKITAWLETENTYDVGEVGVSYGDCARELQAATRLEQFMPPLREWPEDAEWCAIQPNGSREFFEKEPAVEYPFLESWGDGSLLNCIDSWPDDPAPVGVDFRTLKVSRSDMERWEAER